jgi:hypothetical protein
MDSTRLPRFNRSTCIAPMRLTARDREILKHVHRHRFLRSDHLASLIPGSRQQLLRRLQLLYHHGFLERPRCQIDYYHRSGSRTIAYGLGNKGAGFLKRELSLPFHRLDWPHKNRVERLFLEHALMVSDFMVRLELACRSRTDVRLLDLEVLETANIKRRQPFQWKVEIGRGQRCGVIPDRVFGLEFAGKPAGQNRVWFFLEADRGTMPVTRSRLDQSSYHRKLLAYQATWTQNLHRKLGISRFRVLTITTSADRLASMLEACRALPRGHGLFLFGDQMGFERSDPLTFSWSSLRASGVAFEAIAGASGPPVGMCPEARLGEVPLL